MADLAERVGLLELGRSSTGRKSSIDLDGILQSKLFKQPDYSQDTLYSSVTTKDSQNLSDRDDWR